MIERVDLVDESALRLLRFYPCSTEEIGHIEATNVGNVNWLLGKELCENGGLEADMLYLKTKLGGRIEEPNL